VLNGFNKKRPGELRSIIVRLADCGASKFVSLPLTLSLSLCGPNGQSVLKATRHLEISFC
jgi:hypothetical protein